MHRLVLTKALASKQRQKPLDNKHGIILKNAQIDSANRDLELDTDGDVAIIAEKNIEETTQYSKTGRP